MSQPHNSPKYRPAQEHLKLGSAFFDLVDAANFPSTKLRYRNQAAAKSVGLDDLSDETWVEHFGRFLPLPDNLPQPMALRYHGHQFRNYNPDIGDGRGFLFAQMLDDQDRLLDLGTKGSGQTPWSRSGDGRLTLKGGVREILATELLTAHGVNTSKSFSLVETGEQLQRNDEPSPTRSAVLVRLNHSHIRIGTFQRLLYLKDHESIEKLTHYCIDTYWPEAKNSDDPVLAFFNCVVKAVAKMGAEWFTSGFVHGVLNTDNITITGESFDYGPWRFIPDLDPSFTAAYFDTSGLYAFGRQPDALQWNLARLAECLIPLCDVEKLKPAIETYSAIFETQLQKRTLARLGIKQDTDDSDPLIPLFYQSLRDSEAGFERAFVDLTCGAVATRLAASPNSEFYKTADMKKLIAEIASRKCVAQASEVLDHPMMAQGQAGTTMLIDEVEAIWAWIADNDDWSVFEEKIAAIRTFGTLNTKLMGHMD
jgi:uncharacterized protein YdiU (UPF0061 family)